MSPLTGVLVLDFTTLLPGPLASLMLARAGADVLKFEPPQGDDMRHFPPMVSGESMAFAALNHGKRMRRIDLKSPDALAELRPHLETADVLIEQFRPGVMARLGLGYEAVKAINPRIVYCSITGYGQTGPRAAEAGHDLNYVARSGLLSLSSGGPEHPVMPPLLAADIGGGSMPATLNILLALMQRDRTGMGCHVDIAMADIGATFAWHAIASRRAGLPLPRDGGELFTGGSPRYRCYAASDGRLVAVGALEEKFWRAFTSAIAMPAGLVDDRIDPAATMAFIEKVIAAQPSDHWRALLEPLDCCVTIVATLDEAMADPHFIARGLYGEAAHVPVAEGLKSQG